MTTDLATSCAECGAQWDDHVLRDYRAHWAATHPGLPFQEAPDGQPYRTIPLADIADGILIGTSVAVLPPEAAGIVGTTALGVLHFEFRAGPASLYSQQVVLSDQQLRDLKALVGAAVDQVLKKTRKRR